MNRFRTKKKAKEAEALVRVSTDSEAPSVPAIKSSKTFRRAKKTQEPEPKIEIDLTTALPSSDDFRTSLLMSGLSARFSMLREQDDPKSKIGKASDDSVLFPKRQSRLNDFGFQSHGLSDIAEVSSISGSIRPPFAYSRTDSYHGADGYGTDDDSTYTGSIMNRSKTGEGNNLFGGRQKIYKIPVSASGSSKNLTDGASGGMGGRALYENDVSQSAFQRLREREREQERQERERQERERQEREEAEAQSSRPSSPPPAGYNRNRETSSTTSSAGPSNTRTSTAATSFTSQRTPSLSGAHTPVTSNVPSSGPPSLERSATKTRRLYETGLDQHLHEQQFSAMSRIDTLTRQRTLGAQTPPLGLSPTAGPLQGDRWDRPVLQKASMPNLRAASPPPTGGALGSFDFAPRHNIAGSKPFGMTSPPLSPPMSEHDDPLATALQPNDRGKATALGAFSKPAQPYDENKYSQRQLQMQQGRETPPLRKHSPPRAFVPRQQMNRTRADSSTTMASARSASNSSVQRHFLPQDRIPETLQVETSVPENESVGATTFLSSPDGSQGSLQEIMKEPAKPKTIPRPLDLYARYRQEQPLNLERPPESEHPANRPQFHAQSNELTTAISPAISIPNLQPPTPANAPADSPTLGPTTAGLSGMVRQHLRNDSNSSSVYGGVPSSGLTSRFQLNSPDSALPNEYAAKQNPWESDDWDHDYYKDNNFGHDEPEPEVLPVPSSARFPDMDITDQAPRKASWEKEMESRHTRDGSSETQKERQDFKAELATRRRRVQETLKLKSFVETESRSESPLLGSEWSKEVPQAVNNALGLLKSKSSRGSLIGRTKEPKETKAMKMLGIGNATMNSSPSPGKKSFEEKPWQREEEEMLQGVVKPPTTPPQTKAFRQARRDAQRDRERQVAMRHQQNQQRMASEARTNEPEWTITQMDNQQRQRAPSNDRVPRGAPPNIRTGASSQSRERRQHPPPVTHSLQNGSGRNSKESVGTAHSGSRPASRTSRERSGSDTSGGRSKSRNGSRYRDDLAKAMAEGTSSSGQRYYEDLEIPSARFAPRSPGTPGTGYAQSPIPSPMIGPNDRSRSNSNLAAPAYFDGQKSPMLQPGTEPTEIGLAPRKSPSAPFVVNPTPALISPLPTVSGANTPTTPGFQSQGKIPTHRKRSINKSEISEPRFVSSTSRMTTVNLPPGASLQNGSEAYAPPIPPVNPRRRQTRALFGGLIGMKDELDEIHSMPSATQSTEDMSTFSDDESKIKVRQKLRKVSSEGGNLNARARQIAMAAPSPAVPNFPADTTTPQRAGEGGMF